MKFIVIKPNLKEGLGVVERAAAENLNLPILRNVLIEAEGGKIKLTTTNLEIAINYIVSGKIIEDGRVTVPINTLSGIINNLQSERLNFDGRKNKLEVKTDNYEAGLQGLPTEEFPTTPKVKNNSQYLEIKESVLKDALEQALVASEFSNLRPELNNILMGYSGDHIRIAATDSFRLAEKLIKNDQFKSTHNGKFQLMVPLKTAGELVRVFKGDNPVKIYPDDSQILFQTANFSVLSRLGEGNFPEYGAIVPKKFKLEITLNREEFINALKLVAVFGYKNSEVRVKVSENKKSLEVSSADQSVGENKYLLPAKVTGEGNELVFNWHYLGDVLKVLKNNEIFFGVNDENEPALLRAVGDDSYFYILKPIVGV